MEQIKTIVYLMLENRSLDNVLGWLYKNGYPKNVVPAGSSTVYNGLQTGNYYNPDGNGNPQFVTTVPEGSQDIPTVDPNEPYENVIVQLFNQQTLPDYGTPANMMGFYNDFSGTNPSEAGQIMQCYDPEGLPLLNLLAGWFAVSDAYFSSVPTQTNCNRAFAATGNSIGNDTYFGTSTTAMVDNHWFGNDVNPFDPVSFNGPTIWDVLSQHKFASTSDWMVYYSQYWSDYDEYCFTQDLFWPTLQNYSNFSNISNFMSQAQNGTLPSFSFLEPSWLEAEDGIGYNGTDYHPPANLSSGETFLAQLFLAVFNSPQWENMLFIINFDEHGGTYDHVPPPWGAAAPWSDPSDGTQAPDSYEQNFQFDRFGVRVPLLLISPFIPLQTVFRSETDVPYDHTSVIATILNHFGIPKTEWNLGSRVANAPTFENVISLSQPRTDIPGLPELKTPQTDNSNVPPNDLQIMIARRMLARALQKSGYSKDAFKQVYDERFINFKTARELKKVTGDLLRIILGKSL